MTIQAYSQLLEDVYTHQYLINVPRPDIALVEIGAYDGIAGSNTLMLERELGAQPAYLIEPSPKNVLRIRQSRPDSPALQLAVAGEFGTAVFAGDTPVSGMLHRMTDSYRSHWKIDTYNKYNVITVPMAAVQKVIGYPYIDFLSIDVQGAERSILESFDWARPVGIICIELEGHHAEDDEVCRQLLRAHGFEFRVRLKISEIWIKSDYWRRDEIYDPSYKLELSQYAFGHGSEMHLDELLPHFA